MRVLYIGDPQTYKLYKEGQVPSHWLYGAVEMEKEGNTVLWEKGKRSVFNDLLLVLKHRPDMVFIPNLNLHLHFLLLALSATNLIKTPIYAYLHHEPAVKHGFKSLFYTFLLNGADHLFFLSEKTMEETIKYGFVHSDRCSVPGWGADTDFYGKVKTSDGEYFISTGKENRDFETLIEAFRITGAPLKIITAKSHNGLNYESLKERCENIANIQVVITENSSSVFSMMLDEMSHAKVIVCPLIRSTLNYCVGLSSITDAEGLHKQLIITKNPYHSHERLKKFYQVETVADWVDAIQTLNSHNAVYLENNTFSMKKAYDNMRKYIVN